MKLIIKQLGRITDAEIDLTKTFYLFTGYYNSDLLAFLNNLINLKNIAQFSDYLKIKGFDYNNTLHNSENRLYFINLIIKEYISFLKDCRLMFIQNIDFDLVFQDSEIDNLTNDFETDDLVKTILKKLLNSCEYAINSIGEFQETKKGNTVLLSLDYIEQYLHPQEQVDLIENLLNSYPIYDRIMITTHSPIITDIINNHLLYLQIKELKEDFKKELNNNHLQMKDFIIYNINKKGVLQEYKFEEAGIWFKDFDNIERYIRYTNQDLLQERRELLKSINK